MSDFYISHIIRPSEGKSYTKDGEFVPFTIQIITSLVNERKTISLVIGQKTFLINAQNDFDLVEKIGEALKHFVFKKIDILKFDKEYSSDFVLYVIKHFLDGEKDLQEKINIYNFEK